MNYAIAIRYDITYSFDPFLPIIFQVLTPDNKTIIDNINAKNIFGNR